MPEGMTGRALRDTAGADGGRERPLDRCIVQMMSAAESCVRFNVGAARRKCILPGPIAISIRQLAAERAGKSGTADASRQILLKRDAPPLEVNSQGGDG